YGGRFLNLIPIPGFGSLAALLVAPTTEQSGWVAPTWDAAAFAALAEGVADLAVVDWRGAGVGFMMVVRGRWVCACRVCCVIVVEGMRAASPSRSSEPANLRDLPLYEVHSEADRRVTIEDTAKAVECLQAMSAPVAFARLPSGDHFEYRPVIAELRHKVCPWLETVWQQS